MKRIVVLFAALAAGACTGEPDKTATPDESPAQSLDVAGTVLAKSSDRGVFVVTLESTIRPVPLRRMHRWSVRVADAAGSPVSGATIRFDGGMPAHNHGFPTEPRVTGETAPGLYRLDGVRFSMSGAWRMEFAIAAGDRIDTVVFEFLVPP